MALNGIDISSWQSDIDAGAVDGDFVICKATEGTGYVSPSCDRQYQAAKKAGKLLGVYHYANGGYAVAEADYFLENVSGYIGEAILCLDWESQNNPRFNKGGDAAWIKTWCDRVYEKTGVRPLVYLSASYRSLANGIGDYGLWIAQYANMDATGYQNSPWNEGAYSCAIRQYSSCGRLSGYSGNLDLNKAYMDAAAWKRYANPKGEASTGGATGTVSGGGSGPSSSSGSGGVTPSGSTLDLVYHIVTNDINGDARRDYCGSRYDEVQGFINDTHAASASTLAEWIKAGKYGNNPVRQTVIEACGGKYQEAQSIINGKGGSKTYTVKSGDTLSGIGAKLGVSWKDIASKNGIAAPYTIYPGQKLKY